MKRKPLLFLLLMALFMPLVMNAQGLMKAPRSTALQADPVQHHPTQTEAPQNRDGWLQYDNGEFATFLGAQQAYYWTYGPMYPASMLGNNNTLSKISFYECTYMITDVYIDIYSGGDEEPDTLNLIHSETVELNGTNGMHEVEFAQPITINPTQNLWIVLTVGGTYVMPLCLSEEPNNNWVNNGGWGHLSEMWQPGYGWMIRAYVEYVDPNACPKPSGLTVDNITGHTATLSWSSTAGSTWQICVNDDESHLITTSQNPYTMTGLTAETDYTVKVRTKCSNTDISNWTSNLAFTTDVACPAPEVSIEDITATSANVSWTPNNSVQLRYRQAPASNDFEEGSLGAWTTIDGDGDGYDWYPLVIETIPGHNGSLGLASSASYSGGALTPDNYLVSPRITFGGSISFYACAQDSAWAAEHFGVAISTNGNTDANDFITIQEWTMNYEGTGASKTQGLWGLFTVDLSAYAGQTGYVAIRHFNCTDMFRLNVDDITIVQPGVTEPQQWTTINNNVSNPYPLTGLSPETTYQVQVRSNCTSSNDGYSEWTNGFFTTLPACQAPTNLTIDNITTTGAIVSWTGNANSYNLKVNNQTYNGVTSPYTLSGLTAATIYTVEVQSVCSATSTSTWTSETFVTEFCEEANKCVLTFELSDQYGDTWNGNAIAVVDAATDVIVDILTNDYDYYAETGEYAPQTQTKTLAVCNGRQLQFVWVKGNYPGEASWVIKDVNGEEITSGTGNTNMQTGAILATYTVDCTTTSCRKPTDLQATEISPNSVTLTWTENGQATAWVVWYSFGVRPTTVNVTETSVTLSVTPETSYTVKVRPVCDVNNKWSDEITFTTPATCPLPSDITVETTPNSATLSWTGSVDSYNVRYCVLNQGTTLMEEGFESGFGNWTTVDADDDNHNWFLLSDLTTLYTYYTTIPSWQHSGNDAVISGSYINGVGALTPDNWLISPQVTLGGIASFYARSMMAAYPEQISVYVSTNSTDLDDFILLNTWVPGEEWNQYAVDLSAYSGQGYIAIRNNGTSDQYLVSVDDFTVETPAQWNTLSTAETSITIPDLQMNTAYAYQMQSVCGGTPTAWSALEVFTIMDGNVFLTDGDWNDGSNWSGGTTPAEGSNVTIRANVTIPAGYTAIADQITIEEGGSITIADGGQLKHNTVLEVTMKKFVPGYTGTQDNFKLLAFPFSDVPNVPEGMTAAEGNDFYVFSNSAVEEEWQNNKVTAISSVYAGRGYLYANPEDIELSITGTTYRSYGDYNVYTTANYNANENGDNSGWKLAGNPFTSDAYIYGETNAGIFPMDVMYYDANGDMQTIHCGPVAPMQGFFLRVTETTVIRFYSNPLENGGNAKNLSSHGICLDKKMDKTASQAVSLDKSAYKNVTVVEKKADKTFIILDKKILNKKMGKKLANEDAYSRFKEAKQVLPFKK